MNLYDLTDQFEKLINMGYDDGEQEVFEQLLKELDNGIESKVDNIAKLVKSLSAKENALADEIKAMQAKKKSVENRIESIKHFVKMVFLTRGYNKLPGQVFTLALQNSPPSLNLKTLPENLPNEYQKVTIEADKEKIKADLKDGKVLDFAELVQDTHVRIR